MTYLSFSLYTNSIVTDRSIEFAGLSQHARAAFCTLFVAKGRLHMEFKHTGPLLLLDNSSMMNVMGEGEFSCRNMTFDETRAILDMFEENEVRKCFSNTHIENIIFGYLGIAQKNYRFKDVHHLSVGQEALVFKLYVTESETQPIIHSEDGVEAKKIQNIYVYCQYLTRVK